MSTTTLDGTLDISGTRPVGLGRLTKVEMRKMYDTRAGMWLLIVIAAISVIVLSIFWFVAETHERTFFSFMGIMGSPQGMLLPVLGILLVTQEWGQRTGLVTFTLEPRRGKVLGAKVLAASLFGLAALVLAMALAALGAAVGGAQDPFALFGIDEIPKLVLLQLVGVLTGVGFGLAFLNSAGAIVSYFVLPTAIALVTNLVSWLRDVAPWVDGSPQGQIWQGNDLTGEMWGQMGTYVLLWLVVPMAIGLWRVMRAEIK